MSFSQPHLTSVRWLEFGHLPSVRRAMFIDATRKEAALRQEGDVYRRRAERGRPPPGGPYL